MCGLGAYAQYLLITNRRPDSRQEQKKERRNHDPHRAHPPHSVIDRDPGVAAISTTSPARPRAGLFFCSERLGSGPMAASLVSPVLVGRQAESAALDAALARVIDGEPVT